MNDFRKIIRLLELTFLDENVCDLIMQIDGVMSVEEKFNHWASTKIERLQLL